MYGATAGKVAISTIPLTTNQACCNLSVDANVADYRYVYYYLMSQYEQLAGLANGGAQQNLNAGMIKDFPIDLPSLPTQRQIAAVLGALDDKIEMNDRIIKNLQEQVIAFYDELTSGSGTRACQLCEVAHVNPTRKLSRGSMAPYVEMKDLSTITSYPQSVSQKNYSGGVRFTNGDTLFARITPCMENGKAAYINFLDDEQIAFGSTEYIVLASKDDYPSEFFYCLVRSDEFRDYARSHMTGTSGRQRVSASSIEQYLVPVLSPKTLDAFGMFAKGAFSLSRSFYMEKKTLKQLRDSLLPRLMSGEIDVSDVKLDELADEATAAVAEGT